MNQIPTAVTGQPERVEIPIDYELAMPPEEESDFDNLIRVNLIKSFNPKTVLHLSPLDPSPSVASMLLQYDIDSILLTPDEKTECDLCFHKENGEPIDWLRVEELLKQDGIFIYETTAAVALDVEKEVFAFIGGFGEQFYYFKHNKRQ